MTDKIKVTLIKSVIDRTERQKRTVKSLGLNKISSHKVHSATPQILGMIKKVDHLVKVEQIAK